MGPALVGFVSAFTANKMLADQGLTAATATAEQVDAINAAAGPFGILSMLFKRWSALSPSSETAFPSFLPILSKSKGRSGRTGAVLHPFVWKVQF